MGAILVISIQDLLESRPELPKSRPKSRPRATQSRPRDALSTSKASPTLEKSHKSLIEINTKRFSLKMRFTLFFARGKPQTLYSRSRKRRLIILLFCARSSTLQRDATQCASILSSVRFPVSRWRKVLYIPNREF